MKSIKQKLASLFGLATLLAAAPSLAGGPLAVCQPGVPYLWANGGTDITFNPDQGNLGPAPGPIAVALVGSAFQAWQDIPSSTLSYTPGAQLPVDVDIKPQSCPNRVNIKSKGVFDVAILGTEDFDVREIDTTTVSLEGAAPLRSRYKDETAPVIDGQECECGPKKKDGFVDLTLKFSTEQITAALGEVEDGQEWMLHLTGQLNDGTIIEGTDCILIKRKGK